MGHLSLYGLPITLCILRAADHGLQRHGLTYRSGERERERERERSCGGENETVGERERASEGDNESKEEERENTQVE